MSKKTVAKKTVAKKTVAKKAVAKKTVAKKTVAKKTVAKKTVAKKTVAKKAVAKIPMRRRSVLATRLTPGARVSLHASTVNENICVVACSTNSSRDIKNDREKLHRVKTSCLQLVSQMGVTLGPEVQLYIQIDSGEKRDICEIDFLDLPRSKKLELVAEARKPVFRAHTFRLAHALFDFGRAEALWGEFPIDGSRSGSAPTSTAIPGRTEYRRGVSIFEYSRPPSESAPVRQRNKGITTEAPPKKKSSKRRGSPSSANDLVKKSASARNPNAGSEPSLGLNALHKEINSLYAKIGRVNKSQLNAEERSKQLAECFKNLRMLQEEQAKVIEASYLRDVNIDMKLVSQRTATAEDLIKRYENPPKPSDASSNPAE